MSDPAVRDPASSDAVSRVMQTGFAQVEGARVQIQLGGSKIRSGRMGSCRCRVPVACQTALAIAAAVPTMPISPRPLIPVGLTSSGSSTQSTSISGTSAWAATW